MNVDRMMHLIVFDVQDVIDGDTPKILHPEPLLHLILDLPNQALVSNGKEIIDIQHLCWNNFALTLIMEYELSSVDR